MSKRRRMHRRMRTLRQNEDAAPVDEQLQQFVHRDVGPLVGLLHRHVSLQEHFRMGPPDS